MWARSSLAARAAAAACTHSHVTSHSLTKRVACQVTSLRERVGRAARVVSLAVRLDPPGLVRCSAALLGPRGRSAADLPPADESASLGRPDQDWQLSWQTHETCRFTVESSRLKTQLIFVSRRPRTAHRTCSQQTITDKKHNMHTHATAPSLLSHTPTHATQHAHLDPPGQCLLAPRHIPRPSPTADRPSPHTAPSLTR